MDKKRIVILGGGYAGVHAAKVLHKTFKKHKDKVEIILVDLHNYHTLPNYMRLPVFRVNEAS